MTDSSLKDKESSRAALLRAASRLFAELGYETVSTRDIAEAAGVNLGAIQYHFGSKAGLFVETVHELMLSDQRARIEATVRGPDPKTPDEAALLLGHFVVEHLSYLLRSEQPHACRLMCREILSGSCKDAAMLEALVSSVTSSFIAPLEENLVRIVRILLPGSNDFELQLMVASIVGQCSFFFSHRPFIERMRGASLGEGAMFDAVAAHIIRFSLGALKQPEKLIHRTLIELRLPSRAEFPIRSAV